MFRQQQNVFEDVIGRPPRYGRYCDQPLIDHFCVAVAKATDENLTSENWEYMMDAWEKINESPENG